jgi:NADPH:quinone reductase-like Zn-dependent oxidoreductase
MRAAVVTAFDAPPTCLPFADPVPTGPDDALVDVLAAGLHPRVRSQASGAHYTSTDELPLIPGIDGVGRLRDGGGLVYFVLPDTPHGSMAEQVVIDRRRSIPLPDDSDPLLVAAAMNPAMSSWIALRRRALLQPGQAVFVLGATGNAGRLAVQVAKHLGAGRVVAAGRGPRLTDLPALGADHVIDLTSDPDRVAAELGEQAGDVDIALDYLWGAPTEQALVPLLRGRTDRGRALDWVQIGAVAGPTMALPSAALRSTNLRVMGSGQGSVTPAGILAELPALVDEVNRGTFAVDPRPVPLADVAEAWATPSGGRVVITP